MFRMVCAFAAAAALAAPAGAATTVGEASGAKLSAFFKTAPAGEQEQEQATAPAPAPALQGSISGNRISQQVAWTGPNSFTLSYDAAGDVLTAVINNGPAITRTGFLASLPASLAGNPFAQIGIGVRDPAIAGLVSLSGLTLDGEAASIALNGLDGDGHRFWSIAGEDFRQGFTLSGTLELDQGFAAASTSGDPSILQFTIGAAAIPEPAAWALMIGGFGLVGAALRWRRRANAAIA